MANGTNYNPDDNITLNDNLTLYAKWDSDEYTVAFESNEGTPIDSQIVPTGSPATRPNNPTREGYTFGGWYTDNSTFLNEWDFNNSITKDITLYAKWILEQCIVTFESNGGTPVEQQIVTFDARVTKPKDPTKQGYMFGSWYTDNETFLNEWDFNTIVTESMTLYARWMADEYTVTFESNGGTPVDNQIVPEGDLITRPTNPTRQNYLFDGWYTDNETFLNEWDFNTPVTGEITLYAKWQEIAGQYTINFNSNGGNQIDSQTVIAGDVIVRPTDPTKQGYIFDGWYTDDGTFLNEWDFNTAVTQNITLYAKWKINPSYVLMWVLIFTFIILLVTWMFCKSSKKGEKCHNKQDKKHCS